MIQHMEAAAQAMCEAVYYVHACDVPGDIAEFGTMTANTALAISQAVALYEQKKGDWVVTPKVLHLFDSFKGLPEADGIDKYAPHVMSGMWGKGTCVGYSTAQLQKLVAAHMDPSRILIYEGWFKDTVGEFKRPLSLIHIDCDLYSSTMDVLPSLFSRGLVSQGAMILFDDWNCNLARPDLGERRAWAECVERFRIIYSDEGGYGFMSHRFIVHSYDRPD